jgi:cyclo(L-tyrosyl-L-tyrosyl) synthase
MDSQSEFLVIGMSPGNSYFKQDVINQIIQYGLAKYNKIDLFIPDVPAIATYVGLGYPENIARRDKAIPQGNSLRNRVKNTIVSQAIDPGRIVVFDWRNEAFEDKKEYQDMYYHIKELYQENSSFSHDIKLATRGVLEDNPFRKKAITGKDIETATHYIISEFAFMVLLPSYMPQYDTFAYGYHNSWSVWEDFIAGSYDGRKRESLGFLLLPNFESSHNV